MEDPSRGPPSGFEQSLLPEGHAVYSGMLPERLRLTDARFEELWSLHPAQRPWIHIHGRRVRIPRWQQAFGADYHFSGRTSRAAAVPELVAPFLTWARETLGSRMNGVLVNWYDGALGHYIGAHRDEAKDLAANSWIAMLSFGECRPLRFRPYRGRGFVDYEARDHSAIVIPLETNEAWTHEVPRSKQARGRRVSLTVRAFLHQNGHQNGH